MPDAATRSLRAVRLPALSAVANRCRRQAATTKGQCPGWRDNGSVRAKSLAEAREITRSGCMWCGSGLFGEASCSGGNDSGRAGVLVLVA